MIQQDAASLAHEARPIKALAPGAVIDLAVAIALLVLTIYIFLGIGISRGLSGADDAYNACAASYIAKGYGYSAPSDGYGDGLMIPFGVGMSTGPSVLLPVALGLKMFGYSEAVPICAATLEWGLLLVALLFLINSNVGRHRASLFFAIFFYMIFCTFGFHLEQWSAPLGEVHATFLIALAILWLSMRGHSPQQVWVAGLLFGLAITAKLLSLVAIPGLGLVLVLTHQPWRVGCKTFCKVVVILSIAVIAPTVLLEICKYLTLGPKAYLATWHDFWMFASKSGLPTASAPLADRVHSRLIELRTRFCLGGWKMVILGLLSIASMVRTTDNRVRIALASLLLCFLLLITYWLTLSMGWARYSIIAIILLLLSVAVGSIGAGWRQWAAVSAMVAFLLTSGLGKMRTPLAQADNGFFIASKERSEFDQALTVLRANYDPAKHVFASQWLAPFIRFKYSLDPDFPVYRLDSRPLRDSRKTLFIAQLAFVEPSDPSVSRFLSPSKNDLFRGHYYIVSTCE